MPTKIILDTDVGDDIDDAIAIGLISRSPELELVGITTVYGNTEARSRQARSILVTAGGNWHKVPVSAGCGGTISSRTWRGFDEYLKKALPNQDPESLPEAQLPRPDKRHAVEFLIETIMAGNGDIIPVTIGATTNLAMAIAKEPRIIAKIPRIVAMAGDFRKPFAEYNVICDSEAFGVLLRSGIPMDITPFYVGQVATWTPEHVAKLKVAASPLAQYLYRSIAAWRVGWKKPEHLPCLFDPLAVATIFRPELCTWKRGTVTVELQGGATYGYTQFSEAADGRHRIAWDVERMPALDLVLQRICS
ncbi:MAG: nucleoside hydrolase [Planctomycetota bacterium]